MNEQLLSEVIEERDRQDAKWGKQDHHPVVWMSILMEEVGEAASAVIQDPDFTEYPPYQEFRKEMIQVAAVALAAVECVDEETNE